MPNKRALATAADTGDTDQALQWETHIKSAQIVLTGTTDLNETMVALTAAIELNRASFE